TWSSNTQIGVDARPRRGAINRDALNVTGQSIDDILFPRDSFAAHASGYGLSDGSTRDHLETLSITPTFLIPPHYLKRSLSRPMVEMSCYCSPLRRSPRRGRRLSLRQVGDITNFRLTILDWYQTSCCDSSS